jgi:MerR family transcriptional regulator, thiopeptide resistance regulator
VNSVATFPPPHLFGVVTGADTDREAQGQTRSYSSSEWLSLTAEAAEIEQRLARLHVAGASASSPDARAAAEAHRQHITRWFYNCSHELHRALAEMYLTDERFSEHFDQVAPGLARFVHDAMLANACPTTPVPDAPAADCSPRRRSSRPP